jgi:hypothetical protein
MIKVLYFWAISRCMSKFYKINSKIFTTAGVIVFWSLSCQISQFKAGYMQQTPVENPFSIVYMTSDKNKEICCEGIDDNLKCLECDADLQTGQKYNCKEAPARSEDVQPADLVKAAQDLDKLPQNLSESES